MSLIKDRRSPADSIIERATQIRQQSSWFKSKDGDLSYKKFELFLTWLNNIYALRVAFVTLAFEAGANIKEGQALARHSTPQLTMNVYARARNERLSDLVEKVGKTVLSD